MAALVIAEHDNAGIKPATLNTVTAAAACGGDVYVLVAGATAGVAAKAAAHIAGVAKVIYVEGEQFAHGLAENMAAQVLVIASNYSHILFPATAWGKNVAPRVAAKLDVAQISDITRVDSADTFERPIYAGNAIATVQSADATKVITVRTTAFDPASAAEAAPQPTAARAVSWAPRSARATAPNSLPPRSSFRAAARWAPARSSPRCSRPWPTSWAPRWGLRVPRWTRAMRPTTGKSARPARSSRLSSTSQPVSPARSSIWPA